MAMRIAPDQNQPSAAIEIPLEKPLPEYDLEQLEQPTPRDVDIILVSQGFRDLIDDARGVLMELLANPPAAHPESHGGDLDLTHPAPFELMQLTGAICPGDDEIYRPGLWIVLRDPAEKSGQELSALARARVASIVAELVTRLQLA